MSYHPPPSPIASREEYHQLIESGGFDEGSRVELIEGEIPGDGSIEAQSLALPRLEVTDLLAAARRR